MEWEWVVYAREEFLTLVTIAICTTITYTDIKQVAYAIPLSAHQLRADVGSNEKDCPANRSDKGIESSANERDYSPRLFRNHTSSLLTVVCHILRCWCVWVAGERMAIGPTKDVDGDSDATVDT